MFGTLSLIVGCMFSGKTEELLRLLRRLMIGRKKVQLFKPNIDTRYHPKKVVSHNRIELDAIPIDTDRPEDILKHLDSETEVVGIDEIQFFTPEIVGVIKKLLSKKVNGKYLRVICAGLKQDFRGEVFGSMDRLMVLADDIVALTAICNVCGGDATMTQRLINGKPAPYSEPQVQVGGSESYEARCKMHHVVPGRP